MKLRMILPFVVLVTVHTLIYATDYVQTDWSAGPCEPGPVNIWEDSFSSCDSINFWIDEEVSLGVKQIDFGSRIDINNVDCPRGIVVADFDNDGDMDIFHVNSNGDCCYILENMDGTGTIWNSSVIANMDRPLRAASCDIDGDNDTDIALTSAPLYGTYNNGCVYWLKNINNASSWETILVQDSLLYPNNIEVGYINNDDRQDLHTATSDEPGIYWFESLESSGNSWETHLIDSDIVSKFSCLGDIDSDGDLDIIAGEADGTNIFWWENLGNGQSWTRHILDSNVNYALALAISDVNNDGNQDIIFGEYIASNARLAIIYSNGDGTFSEKEVIADTLVLCRDILVADLDDDGDVDICVGNGNGNDEFLTLYHNEGSEWNDTVFLSNLGELTDLWNADVTGDTRKDLVFAENNNDVVSYLPGSYRYQEEGQLFSSILSVGPAPDMFWNFIAFESIEPYGTDVSVQVRSSTDSTEMGIWSGPLENGDPISMYCNDGDRYFQYRLNLSSTDSTATPIVELFGVDVFLDIEEGTVQPYIGFYGVYENPSSGNAVIRFSLNITTDVTVRIYDITGREVSVLADGEYPEGEHQLYVTNLDPGVYFIKMDAQGTSETKKFVMLNP